MVDFVEIVFVLNWLVAASWANAVMDTLAHHYSVSVFRNWNRNFWHPVVSANNKYKDKLFNRGPAFFGSTTFLVWMTDGWHLMQFVFHSSWQAAIAVAMVDGWMTLVYWAVMKTVFSGLFELNYGYILKK